VSVLTDGTYYITGNRGVSSKTYNKNVLAYTLDVKMHSMPKSRLPELIDKARNSGLTFRDIRRRSGDQIPLSTLNALQKGKDPAPNLTTETIMALAKGLGESPTIVFEAAIGKSATGIRDESVAQLFEDLLRLSPRDRQDPHIVVILEMLRAEIQKRLDRDA
jgi:hypothetical protein